VSFWLTRRVRYQALCQTRVRTKLSSFRAHRPGAGRGSSASGSYVPSAHAAGVPVAGSRDPIRVSASHEIRTSTLRASTVSVAPKLKNGFSEGRPEV